MFGFAGGGAGAQGSSEQGFYALKRGGIAVDQAFLETCDQCRGRVRIIASIEDPAVIPETHSSTRHESWTCPFLG